MGREPLVLGPFELRLYIENLREELIDIGQKKGLSHQLTIQVSEQLDFFLNEYKKATDKRTNLQ
ncbi:aspartyl-phosphate phosphatase Spo0E family protein [Neobacillus mesonae]|uniref:aspartyl-phosphate phosphatase Spo0E family protein n=1 Tax=Neobacillus mesonae TaxID=1193713 RepID=UPI000834258F|nr:aspartyl-phosphate phosphatase Spo0E family protein [Neobacillus mesonae]MED4206901.1 aspartyl-phosphate phosphatase Spo0E family protein [Neobacillus mesonae]